MIERRVKKIASQSAIKPAEVPWLLVLGSPCNQPLPDAIHIRGLIAQHARREARGGLPSSACCRSSWLLLPWLRGGRGGVASPIQILTLSPTLL